MSSLRPENLPKIDLPVDSELDEETLAFLGSVPQLNVWRMIARTGMAREYQALLSVMFGPEWIPGADREVIALRTFQQNDSDYEVPQHLVMAQTVGLSQEDSRAVLEDDLDRLTPWRRRLCHMVDEMAARAKLNATEVQELVAHYGSQDRAAQAIMTMAWFHMLTRFVDSTGVPVDAAPDAYTGLSAPTTKG
ncbi:carboxymuconolactone decarboxylase family protein [Streptomyces sp. NPDC006879]|uniref:carboxymuconolactone decarboxylase family protein n=1 Tax=Streptomyces sp. NPDC006879 TaxID=3364767 RepID=UPI00369145F4